MALTKLKLATLATMDDGRLAVAFEQHLRRCELDIKDRPGVESERVITMTISMKPKSHTTETGQVILESVKSTVKMHDSVPKRKSAPYDLQLDPRGGLLFNDASLDNALQGTLDDVVKENKVD